MNLHVHTNLVSFDCERYWKYFASYTKHKAGQSVKEWVAYVSVENDKSVELKIFKVLRLLNIVFCKC